MPRARWRLNGKTCAVVGCKNRDGDIRQWKASVCEVHAPQLHQECPCPRPFSMHRIPQGEKNKLLRQCWLANLQREDFDPGTSSRVCSVHFVDGRPTEDNPYPTLRLGTLNVPYKGKRRATHTAPSQLWPSAPSTGSSPQRYVADEPNDDYSAAFADDDMNDSLPAKNQLGPGIVTYEWAFRANKKALVPTKCSSCGCSCKGIRKMDKGVQTPPEEDQDYTYHTDVQVHVKQEIF